MSMIPTIELMKNLFFVNAILQIHSFAYPVYNKYPIIYINIIKISPLMVRNEEADRDECYIYIALDFSKDRR